MPDDWLARVRQADHPILLIDGRSGSGKSTLAERIAPALNAQLVRLDDIYPGWSGLAAASHHVHDHILNPTNPRWQQWDWQNAKPGPWHDLDPELPLVVEGVGTLTRANRALATFAVWLERDAETRKRLALARDGALFAAHWDEWAAQEDEFIAKENPRELADLEL
ncbi:MAG: aminobenzoate synthetase [Microbacteriaceae bacterium]|nr:aminobenzoate synthetase [Microbacteriaceae bacterium]